VIIASRVTAPDGRVFETSKAWLERVQDIVGSDDGVTIAGMAGAASVGASPETKTALGLATNAVAVDMESHAVGAAAQEAGVPFMIIRAVADPVNRALPGWVLGNISENGAPRYGAILAGLAVHPWDFPALIRLKGDSDRALRSLRGVAGRLGPLLGLG
jgi:adenosylhomocysteine nucleosidase